MARRSSTHPDILKPKLYHRFLLLVANDLVDTELIETGVGLTDSQLHGFIRRHNSVIKACVDDMYDTAAADGDLKSLKKPELGWFRESFSEQLLNLIDAARADPGAYDCHCT